jgi:hypothetical protein
LVLAGVSLQEILHLFTHSHYEGLFVFCLHPLLGSV